MFNLLWVGVLIGVLLGTFALEWLKIAVFVIALVFSDLAHGASSNVRDVGNLHFAVPPWLIGIGGVAFGLWAWHHARRRGLQHLGQAEFRTRWTNVRGISKWGW